MTPAEHIHALLRTGCIVMLSGAALVFAPGAVLTLSHAIQGAADTQRASLKADVDAVKKELLAFVAAEGDKNRATLLAANEKWARTLDNRIALIQKDLADLSRDAIASTDNRVASIQMDLVKQLDALRADAREQANRTRTDFLPTTQAINEVAHQMSLSVPVLTASTEKTALAIQRTAVDGEAGVHALADGATALNATAHSVDRWVERQTSRKPPFWLRILGIH